MDKTNGFYTWQLNPTRRCLYIILTLYNFILKLLIAKHILLNRLPLEGAKNGTVYFHLQACSFR
jgi:hypothetical protein